MQVPVSDVKTLFLNLNITKVEVWNKNRRKNVLVAFSFLIWHFFLILFLNVLISFAVCKLHFLEEITQINLY